MSSVLTPSNHILVTETHMSVPFPVIVDRETAEKNVIMREHLLVMVQLSIQIDYDNFKAKFIGP